MYMRPFPVLLVAIVLMAVPATAQTAGQGAADTPQPANIQETQTPPEQVHLPPAHTGWASLVKDTAQDFVAFPKRKSTWTLLAAGAGAALVAHQADNYVERHVVGNNKANNFFTLGQWIGSAYVQTGASVGLWVVGRYIIAPAADEPRTNKWSHVGFDLMRAQIVSQTLVHAMKYSVRRDRPTGECCAFPSGHSATAFAAAAVLERHFGYRGSWPVLATATYVAASRLVDNRHFLSDVVFGAALGTATGWTVVGIHGRDQYALHPVPVRGGMMIALVRVNE